ncbi:hypothetical protein G6F37_004637 [Rhizopus arrhizus]|nr:hypothetical protein G6F38_004884 [Rhizopus arrhizus]KAG1159721.1 hypothetical protein G6F37_004637 [Rhizopus arrhizus]
MDSLDKRSTKSLSGYYDKDELTNYEEYNEDDIPMSMEEKALVRKIDLFLMPLVCLIDFFQYIDKATLTYAVTLDFNKDLKLTGFEFSFIASIFYLGYFLYQLPNNYFLQKVSIKKYIGFLLFIWGTVIACTAACSNFAQVAAMRFLLGFFEAGIYPALTLLISTFYRRSEQAARLGLFWVFNGIATIVGGLVSYGVATMGPSYGLSKWRWLMLILGCATCATGVFSYFFLIDNPKSSVLKLNAEQEILVEERTRDNAVGIQASFITLGGGAAVILWIGGSVLLAQRINQTIYTIAVLMLIDVVGLILLLVITDVRLKLIGIYIMWAYTGAYVLIVASISNNVTGYTKKIFYNGMFMIFYTIGNFVGPFLMVENTKPSYAPAIITYICCNFVCAILVLIARMKMAAINKKRIANPSAEIINVEDDLTDIQDPNFLYRL